MDRDLASRIVSHTLPQPGYQMWWDRLDPEVRRELTRHAYTALPDHLADVVLAEPTEIELVVADDFGVDRRWYLSREAAAFVADRARHPHLSLHQSLAK
jgi:hypothetical protein